MIKRIKNIYARLTSKKIHKSRKVAKAKFMYYYTILSAIGMVLFFIAWLILNSMQLISFHWHWTFTPVYLLVGYFGTLSVAKNRKLIWLYISDVDQGKLLLYLNKYTHFSEDHKMRLINWVYLKPGKVRLETYQRIYQLILDKKEVSEEERKLVKLKPVSCPQQLKGDQAGWNEAMLVAALQYAHFNISVLDLDLRDIMNLTDDNLIAFNITKEAEKAKSKKYQRMIEIGKKNAAKLNGEVQ